MCTSIHNNNQWTPKPNKNVVIYEFCCNNNYVGVLSFHLHPLGSIISGIKGISC